MSDKLAFFSVAMAATWILRHQVQMPTYMCVNCKEMHHAPIIDWNGHKYCSYCRFALPNQQLPQQQLSILDPMVR